MLKKSIKKIFTLLVCVGLLGLNTVPAFAKSRDDGPDRTPTTPPISTVTPVQFNNGSYNPPSPIGIELVDGASISARSLSGTATYSMVAADTEERCFSITSAVPTRVLLQVVGSHNNTCFDSGDFRMGPIFIGLHLLPRAQYTLVVMTQNNVEANITVSMTKGTTCFNYVYLANTPSIIEKNVLGRSQSEVLDFQFKDAGRYRISVSTDTPNLVYASLATASSTQALSMLNGDDTTYFYKNIDVTSSLDSAGNIIPAKCYLTIRTGYTANAKLLARYTVEIIKID